MQRVRVVDDDPDMRQAIHEVRQAIHEDSIPEASAADAPLGEDAATDPPTAGG